MKPPMTLLNKNLVLTPSPDIRFDSLEEPLHRGPVYILYIECIRRVEDWPGDIIE